MEYVLYYLVNVAFTWVSLMVVIPIAQKLADFSMPPVLERMWKLAVVAAVVCGVSLALGFVNPWLARIGSAIAAFALFYKWFDMDLFGAFIVAIVNGILQTILGFILLAWLVSQVSH